MAATTGAVDRNFFIVGQSLLKGGLCNQRGETVMFESLSVSLPLLNSLMAATGHVAALMTDLIASDVSS